MLPVTPMPSNPDHGLWLLALDGTRFNLRNTGAINSNAVKSPCSRGDGEPASAHLLAVVLVELGPHQPLAVAFRMAG